MSLQELPDETERDMWTPEQKKSAKEYIAMARESLDRIEERKQEK